MDKDIEKMREEVISQLRACLISTKGARDLRQIRSDYQMLMGGDIPFKTLGFSTLELFLRSVPTLRVTQQNGQTLVDAVVSQQSAHIAKFVGRQKTKKRPSRPPPRQYHQRQEVPPRWRPRTVATNWNRQNQAPRTAVSTHTQLISSPQAPVKRVSVKDRLGPRETPIIANHFEPSRSSITLPGPSRSLSRLSNNVEPSKNSFAVNSLRQALNGIEEDKSEEDVNLTKLSKQRLSQRVVTPEPTQTDNQSPLSVPFPPDFLKWPLEVTQMDAVRKPEVAIAKFERTGDDWEDLKSYVDLHNLGEIISKITTSKPQSQRRQIYFYCTIEVDNVKYSSYPADCHNEKSAIVEASKIALNELEKKYQCKPQQGLLLSDHADVLVRVPPMVKEHVHGVWSSKIQEEYIAQYGEQLPLNWIELLTNLPNIAVLQQTNNMHILNYCDPNQKTNFSNPQVHNVSVLPNTVHFNEDGFLIAEITCINSAAEMWFTQRETPESDKFSAMALDMDAHYAKHGKYELASGIQIGGHYVACFDTTWCRVRVFEVNNNDIHCFCIDFGDEMVIKKDALYKLKQEFADVQAQAFVCRLAGLEELYEVSKSSEHLQTFQGKIVHVQQANNSEDSETDPTDPTLSVILYDMDTGKPINEEIIISIGIEVASPALLVNTPTDVYVTSVLEDGTVYIQTRTVGYEQLMSLVEKAGQNILEHKISVTPVKVSKSNGDDLYFVRSKVDEAWYRVKIIDWAPNEKFAQLLQIDDGKSPVVNVESTDFYILRDISDVISKFPPQGLQVKLNLKSIPVNFVERVEELMPPHEVVIVKLIKVDVDYAHIVEFYKLSKPNNVLFSINNSLVTDNGLKNGDGNNNFSSKSNKLQRLISLNQFEDINQKMPSAGLLSCPDIPQLETFFDVKVTDAVHPHSFFVQPYDSVNELNALMSELQETFKDAHVSHIQTSEIVTGRVFASKYKDGKWYRTSVIRMIHAGSISVFYSDFGYYGNVVLDKLFPLADKFLKLPYQALKAKLDVQPKNAKWVYEDCDYFKNLVGSKCFVSIIKAIEKDVLCPGDIVLTLKLIDTSQNEDVFIDDVMIQEGRAIANC